MQIQLIFCGGEINLKKIAIIVNRNKDKDLAVTKRLINILSGKAQICMDNEYSQSEVTGVDFCDNVYEKADAVIVLGGDGTILQAAEPCADRDIPIMGINLGRIGFMTEIEVRDMENAVASLLSGDYKIEQRMMMKICVGEECEYYALNDAVISKIGAAMISLELYSEEEKINEYMADGVIISTATGSTGYSLSAGGPVADPCMEIFIASPICAHMLSSRTAVFSADKKMRIVLTEKGSGSAEVTIDGNVTSRLYKGEGIEITKADKKVKLIKMGGQSFYDVLTNKLS